MNTLNSNSIPTKHELCIYELLRAGTKGIHKIGAPQQAFGETCLPTTISELGLKRGVVINRERRKHTHRAGGQTSFTWYWLPDRDKARKAIKILNQLRAKRNAPPLDGLEEEAMLCLFPEPAHPAA